MNLNDEIISTINEQKNRLIQLQPALQHHFVDIDPLSCQKIPFLPIRMFRQFHVFQKNQPHITFYSSGSTNSIRAQHSFTREGLEHYKNETCSNFASFLKHQNIPLNTPIVSLIPPTQTWPTSSLAAMIGMFAERGFDVCFVNIDNSATILDASLRWHDNDDVIIFGTSFHHLIAAQNDFGKYFRNKNIILIDTGGTKGRTRNFSLDELIAITKQTYAESKSFNFVSEYGMCELASQAWSLNHMHDGWFKTNSTLIPLIIDLDNRCVAAENSVGFLAFIDAVNTESFSAIITEDLAYMDAEKGRDCFKLVSRAPDASLKGCSLNVKENFSSCGKSFKSPLPPFSKGELLWDVFAQHDLSLCLSSISQAHEMKLEKTRLNQKVLFILPSNIPIAWLYPAIIFSLRGVAEIHLQLPSLRSGDPLSERIREQSYDLVKQMQTSLPLVLHEERDIAFERMHEFDAVVVFGTDETIQTFTHHLGQKVIGLGHVTNALRINNQSNIVDVAQTCSRWFGRGCLTPVALVSETLLDDNFAQNFAREFDHEMTNRYQAAALENTFAHRHTLLEIEAFIKSMGLIPAEHIFYGSNSWTVDVSDPQFQGAQIKHLLQAGGAGLVFFLPRGYKEKLEFYTHDPALQDAHAGKKWEEIIP